MGPRRLAALAVAVLAGTVACPGAAQAKSVSDVRVCGAGDRCVTYDRSSAGDLTYLAHDGGAADPPAAAAPWYRVRFTVDEREHGGGFARWTVAYVPSAARLRVQDGVERFAWVSLRPRTAALFRRAVRDLPALPAARLRGLDAAPPRARVDAVYPAPGEATASRDRAAAATPRWVWIAAGAIAALALAALARRRRPQPLSTPG